jgi:hypothetical protein
LTLVTGPRQIFFARLQDHFGQRDRSASGKTGQFSHLATDVCRTQTLSVGIAVAAVATATHEIARLRRAGGLFRASRRSKRSGHKCSRTEIDKSAYAEEKAGDETEIDQSFA